MEAEDKLFRLWINLLPNRAQQKKGFVEYEDIGFQSADPVKDFRGVGMLALEQLLQLTDEKSIYRQYSLLMHRDSI